MRYLGIDYGTKRIGIAVSSENIAFPRGVAENHADLFLIIVDIIEKEKITNIVVGDTRSFGGYDNSVTKELEAFVERLKEETNLPVVAAWEAGSSVEASRHAPDDKPHDDGAAAAIILQRYLDGLH